MNQKKMSIFGIGPMLAIFTMIYASLMYFMAKIIGEAGIITKVPDIAIYAISSFLLIIGIPFFVISAKTLLKGFPEGKLMTDGVYSIVRNPLYSSFICFIVPALVILTKSILIMTTPIFMYFLFKVLIKKEEEDLEHVFGKEYSNYKDTVGSVIPFAEIFKNN